MATSGTTAFEMDFTEIAEEAFERAGRQMMSGYDARTARRSLNLMLIEWQNRGMNMWTVDESSVPLVAGTAEYTLPADTIDLVDHVLRSGSGTSQSDLTITRVSVATYASIPNKNITGRPHQLYINRLAAAPTVTVWPVPDVSTYTLQYWRLRRIEDAGDGIETPDVAFRFLPALVAGLAYHIAVKIPEGAPRLQMLELAYEKQYKMAASEDREKATYRLVPRIARI
jgi:hypothetical protein